MKKAFRIIGYLEALSIIALFGVAMPMKYAFGHLEATQLPGMIHGILFMAYLGLAGSLASEESWPKKKLFFAFIASVLPLGTLWFDWKYLHGQDLPAATASSA